MSANLSPQSLQASRPRRDLEAGTDPHAILLSHFLVPPHLLSKDLPLFLDLLLLPHSSFWVGIIVEVEGCAGCTVELKRIRSCFKYRIGGKSIFKFWNKFE